MSGLTRRRTGAAVMAVVIGAVVAVSGCSADRSPESSAASKPSGASTTRPPVGSSPGHRACAPTVVAIDPGHNPVRIEGFDPVTGVAMIDYPNGAEDHDVFVVSEKVRAVLVDGGYRVVLVKHSPVESVTYRQRVDRARAAGAALAISIHTSPGAHQVFEQRVGLYREGVGADGKRVRVEFTNHATASRSQAYASAIAAARSRVEGRAVQVVDNDFGGRAPLWAGNIPMISLIAGDVPWVYNEFGSDAAGGSIPLPKESLDVYARGVAAGVRAALPLDAAGCRIPA